MLHALRHQPLAGFADMAQLAFEARNVAVDRVELALNRIGRIAGRIVIGSRLFQLTLDFAQPCGQLFDLGRHLLQFGAEPAGFASGFFMPQPPQQVLLLSLLELHRREAPRHFGLLGQFVDLGVEFAAYIRDPCQVLARVLQPRFGLAAPLLVA